MGKMKTNTTKYLLHFIETAMSIDSNVSVSFAPFDKISTIITVAINVNDTTVDTSFVKTELELNKSERNVIEATARHDAKYYIAQIHRSIERLNP